MKRLLRISFDLFLLSFIPVMQWLLLGIIVDKSLINIFSLTYPFQFIYQIIKAIFSTGANISKEKDNDNNSVMNGIFWGNIVSILVFGFILFNIDNYINFMSMDISIYRNFSIYYVVNLFICLEFAMVLQKLYYEEKNELANKYSLIYNSLNFFLTIGISLITKNQFIIIIGTLIPLTIFTLHIMFKNYSRFKINFKILNYIKYNSVETFNSLAFFLIYLFGYSNAFEYGSNYAAAMTFAALITDTQLDSIDAISVKAKVDISKNHFNYNDSIKDGYKLELIMFLTTLIMFISLYSFYDLDIKLVLIYLGVEIYNFLVYPIYEIQTNYFQLEWSSLKITSNKILVSIFRFLASFLHTPFCTGIGQIISATYQFITCKIIFKRNFKVNEIGDIEKI